MSTRLVQSPLLSGFQPSWRPTLLVATPLFVAIILRFCLIPVESMPFDSDEAIFLLMSRHILAGERPLFFYGEAYGGSADSYLTALFFYFLGQKIAVARLVQSLEYLVGMGCTYLLARRLLPGARLGPPAVLWLMAIPPLLLTTWTTPAVLYAVVIGLGGVISYLGYRLLFEDAERRGRWLLFGMVCGLAFWTFGILVVYMVPVFILFLWQFRRRRLPNYLLASLAFFLGSLPWWTQALAGLQVVYNPEASPVIPPLWFRLLAFFSLTLPGFFGFRQPWAPEIFWPALVVPLLIFYAAASLYAIPWLRRRDPGQPRVEPVGFILLGLQTVVWLGLYFGTRFSLDATGRYILPLYPVLFIVAGLFLERIYRWRRPAAIGLLAALLAFNLAAHLKAIQRVPPGITAQMNPVLWFGNEYDQALIDFVAAHGGRGYSHHWISYKIAFLSDERVILAAFLPYRPDLRWLPLDNRYPPYAEAVAASPQRVYVTHREPNLEAYLRSAFAERQITYQIKDIGPYRVYYDFSVVVTPQEIGLGPGQ
ncbi:MAG: glycosyltransferase family 39 protein [Chloroflexota bacterium]